MSAKNAITQLKDDITHCFCCKCLSRARPLSLTFCGFASTLFVLGIAFIFVGAAVATRNMPQSNMVDAYNSYANAYGPYSAFIGDGLLPANVSVTMTNNSVSSDELLLSTTNSLSSTVTVRNVTLSSVPYTKSFLGLDADDVDMLYANPNEPVYQVSANPCGVAMATFSSWSPSSPNVADNPAHFLHGDPHSGQLPSVPTIVFNDQVQVIERATSNSNTTQLLQLAVSFSGANATLPIRRSVTTTSYTVKDGPAYCSPIDRCTQKFMTISCQKSYGCADCYFMLQEPQEPIGLGNHYGGGSGDEPTVCPTPGAPCGICVHEIYLSSYCLVIDYDLSRGTYVEDPYYESCNWPFGPENQVFTRVAAYGDAAPNISSVVVRTRNDPYLFLESLTNGTMTFELEWPEFRSQGPLLVAIGFYFIIMGSILACILCCYSRKLFCCNFCSARSDTMPRF